MALCGSLGVKQARPRVGTFPEPASLFALFPWLLAIGYWLLSLPVQRLSSF
jgi:hypothetical protein